MFGGRVPGSGSIDASPVFEGEGPFWRLGRPMDWGGGGESGRRRVDERVNADDSYCVFGLDEVDEWREGSVERFGVNSGRAC